MAKKKAKLSALDAALAAATVEDGPKKAKDKNRVNLVMGKDGQAIVSEVKQIVLEIADLETKRDALVDEKIRPHVQKGYEKVNSTPGPWKNHFVLTGAGKETVAVIYKHAYTAVPVTRADALEAIVGEENYEDRFEEKMAISIKDEVATDEKQMTALITALGAKKFAEMFDVKRALAPTELFTQGRHRDFSPEKNAELDKLVKPHKAQFRGK